MKQELIEAIKNAREALKDFDTFKHLFSGDAAERTLAKLYETVCRIEFLLRLSDLKDVVYPKNNIIEARFGNKIGTLVQIRPCGEDYQGKTYLGFYLGDIARSFSFAISEDNIQCNWSRHNPAIFVPELKKIVYGYESWWQVIRSEDQLRQISDDDIQNVWYVKLLKQEIENGDIGKENDNGL